MGADDDKKKSPPVVYPTDGQHAIRWGMPIKMSPGEIGPHDKELEAHAAKNLHNIDADEINRRYTIAAGGAFASAGLGAVLLKSGAPRVFRVAMCVPLGVMCGFYMSASEGTT